MFKRYHNGDYIDSPKSYYHKNSTNHFHIELIECIHPCTIINGSRIIMLNQYDIVLSRNFRHLKIINGPNRNCIYHFGTDIVYPEPLNDYMIGNSPIIHDLMNEQVHTLTYITFNHLDDLICHHYLMNIRIFNAKLNEPIIEFQNQRLWGLLFTELLRHYESKISKFDSDFPSSNIKHASKISKSGRIMSYIRQHNGNVTLNSVATHFKYEPAYFSRLCNNLFETNFSGIRTEIRMEAASDMLQLTAKNIDEISAEVGYKNTSSFIKQFTQKRGITPLNFRKKYHK